MPKQARLSGIKGFRTYTIEEAADISGVSTRTIRNWSVNGLRVMATGRPVLIRGDDLREFIKTQRAARKVELAIDAFYCVRCRASRHAAGGFADCTVNGTRATLSALCEVCETVLSKPVAQAHIPMIAATLDLKIKRQETTL